ncbi:MAG: ParB/RepB/Spo0J family partition protein [Clostridiales bacterium]|jgi:ParB family chromosome partitioning protein|nr:ParB/RepB/Spo0J family partition protein [Clostridiales bacterium]
MSRKIQNGGAPESDNRQLTLNLFCGGRVTEIPLAELHEPDPHPFLVRDDDAMGLLAESVRQHGVREPGLARPRSEGGYELLCGNRRKRACEIAGLPALHVIVRDLDDQAAAIAMVDSNLQQREKLLFSERAWAYRVKMEALNHSGLKAEQNSVDVLNGQTGESRNQIFRLIRLTELVDPILDRVDARELAFNTGVELSYLSYDEQFIVADAMDRHGVKPSLSQAVRCRQLKKDGKLTPERIDGILAEPKESPVGEQTTRLKYRRYFPASKYGKSSQYENPAPAASRPT